MSTAIWVLKANANQILFYLGSLDIMRKIVSLSMVAAASLALAACGGSEPAATDNATVTEMNAADAMEGTTNDAMTNVDGAMAADNAMAADANATDAAANSTDAAAANSTDAAAK